LLLFVFHPVDIGQSIFTGKRYKKLKAHQTSRKCSGYTLP